MELLQTIAVLITFLGAVFYVVTKFIWKPAFLKSKSDKGCGSGSCGC